MKSTSTIKKNNVFISYNKKDNEIAREIALFLTAEDISVWFDEWEISAGDSIIEEINSGLSGCTHFIIIWSKNSAKSNWVKKELEVILSKAIKDRFPRIVPVRIDKEPLPPLLLNIKYIRYNDGSEKDRENIVDSISGLKPSQNLTKAIVKKYDELIYDDTNTGDPLPFKACPQCGSDKLHRSSATDYQRDEVYYSIKCKDCGWSDWSQ